MGCVSTVGRIVLVILNLVFLLVSLALIAAGAVLKFFLDKITPFLGSFDAVNEAQRGQLNIPSLKDVTELPFVSEAGVALLVLGCVLFAISFCACCGACYTFRPLLVVFAILMTVLVIGQAVIAGLFLSKNSALHKTIKEQLMDQMTDEYKEDGDNVLSQSINMMNYLLDCCGINGASDFQGGTPVQSCCKTSVSTNPSTFAQCSNPSANLASFNTKGCYDKLLDKALSQKTLAGIIVGLLLGLQVAEIVFAILLVKGGSSVGPV